MFKLHRAIAHTLKAYSRKMNTTTQPKVKLTTVNSASEGMKHQEYIVYIITGSVIVLIIMTVIAVFVTVMVKKMKKRKKSKLTTAVPLSTWQSTADRGQFGCGNESLRSEEVQSAMALPLPSPRHLHNARRFTVVEGGFSSFKVRS